MVAAALVVLHLTNPSVGHFYGEFESKFYVKNVHHALEEPIDPHFGYRLLPPLLVRMLPVSDETGFAAIAYLSLFGAAFLLVSILRHHGVAPGLALLTSVLFLSAPCSTKWLVAYSSGTDAFHLFLIAACYRCIQLGWWLPFSAVLLAGVFTKVTIVVLWPTALLYVLREHGSLRNLPYKRLGRWAFSIVPAAVCFVLVREVWPSEYSGYTHIRYIHSILARKFYQGSALGSVTFFVPQVVEFFMAFFVVYGVAALVLVLYWRESLSFLKKYPEMLSLLVLTSVTSFIGGVDSARYQIYAFVPVLLAFGLTVQSHEGFFSRPAVWLPFGAIQLGLSNALNFRVEQYERYMPHYMPSRSVALPYLAVLGLTFLALAGARYALIGRRARAPS